MNAWVWCCDECPEEVVVEISGNVQEATQLARILGWRIDPGCHCPEHA